MRFSFRNQTYASRVELLTFMDPFDMFFGHILIK